MHLASHISSNVVSHIVSVESTPANPEYINADVSFDSTTGWTLGSGWSISSGELSFFSEDAGGPYTEAALRYHIDSNLTYVFSISTTSFPIGSELSITLVCSDGSQSFSVLYTGSASQDISVTPNVGVNWAGSQNYIRIATVGFTTCSIGSVSLQETQDEI